MMTDSRKIQALESLIRVLEKGLIGVAAEPLNDSARNYVESMRSAIQMTRASIVGDVETVNRELQRAMPMLEALANEYGVSTDDGLMEAAEALDINAMGDIQTNI